MNLGTVIVNTEASKHQTGDVSIKDSSTFSSVIGESSFKAKDLSVGEAVETETSVQVKQSGGLGSFSSMSLRGSSSNQVMIYMDGVPLNDSSGGGVDLSTIPVSQVESIEIYKGTTPINFSGASIGGAVNIKTKRVKSKPEGNITVGYGSFNTFKISPFVSHKPGKFDYLISGEYVNSKNNFSFLNNNGTKWNLDDDSRQKRNNAQFAQGNFITSIGYDFSQNTRLVFSNQYFQKGQHLPSWNNSPKTNTTFNTTRNIASIKLIADKVAELAINSATRIDYLYKKEVYDDTGNNIGLGGQYNRYRTNTYGVNQFIEWPTQHNILSGSIDLRKEGYRMYDLLNNNDDPPSSRNYYALSLEDKIILFDNSFMIIPATVIEHYDNNFDSSSTPRNESHNYFNPKLGLKYFVINWINIKTNIAKYIREPSFFELFGDRGFFNGNSDLKAESGTNFDLGIEVNKNIYGLPISSLRFNSAYFMSNVKDVISYVYNSRGIGQAVNISESMTNGVETSLVIDFIKYISLSSNYTWQSPVNKSQIAAFDGKKLPGRFQNTATIKIEGIYKIIKPYYEFLYASGLYYDTANLLPAPIKREHNAGATLFIKDFSLTAEVKNIGNKNYEDFNGYPQPGRSFWLTLRYELN